MSNLKFDSRQIISDEDMRRAAEADPSPFEFDARRAIVEETLRRAAKAWGVTERRVDGWVSSDLSDGTAYLWVHRDSAMASAGVPLKAVAYISDPAPKPSAEERIQAALEYLGGGYDKVTNRLISILRGDES